MFNIFQKSVHLERQNFHCHDEKTTFLPQVAVTKSINARLGKPVPRTASLSKFFLRFRLTVQLPQRDRADGNKLQISDNSRCIYLDRSPCLTALRGPTMLLTTLLPRVH